jgi:uncharacterized membrane protein YcaP (DUF421 family)
MIRLAGKREVGQLAPVDLLGMLLLSEMVSPALTSNDTSVAGALVAAAALLATSVAVSRVAYWYPRAERWIEGAPTPLISDGTLLPDAVRSERISVHDLEAALRRHGLERVDQVRRAVVETNGEITIVPRDAGK